MKPVLERGSTCLESARADRLAVILDAADYFEALVDALRAARRSVWIVGWDVDSRVRLARGTEDIRLGDLLDEIAGERRELDVRVLVWDFSMLFALEREPAPVFALRWKTGGRARVEMDDEHPLGASHHQKFVVVDDRLAFVGGVDLTSHRWDTSEHSAGDPGRTTPDGDAYGPYHDVQTAVSGDAARLVGDCFRERWARAVGERIPRPEKDVGPDPWPEGLAVDAEDVEVAVSRTLPAYKGEAEVREVRALYLAAARAATRYLYMENQYFTWKELADVLAEGLRREKGPEVVLVLPDHASGWLASNILDVKRARLLIRLRDADLHGRLTVAHPRNAAGEEIYVHSKLMIADDEFMTVGSANLANRSMGLDTELHLSFEGREEAARALDRLLAEKVGVTPEEVRRTASRQGSMAEIVREIDPEGRRLVSFDMDELAGIAERELPEGASLADPEHPLEADRVVDSFIEEAEEDDGPAGRTRALVKVALGVGLLAALAALWRFTPLGDWLAPGRLVAAGVVVRESALTPLWMVAVFVLGGFAMVPLILLVVVTASVFPPHMALAYSLAGSLASAFAGYLAGGLLGRKTVRRFAGERVNRLSRALAKRGILSVAVARNLPIAPFMIVNVVAGASHIGLRDYLVGTAVGMLPGLIALTLFSDGVTRAFADPSPENLAWAAGAALLLGGVAYWIRRRFTRGNGAEAK